MSEQANIPDTIPTPAVGDVVAWEVPAKPGADEHAAIGLVAEVTDKHVIVDGGYYFGRDDLMMVGTDVEVRLWPGTSTEGKRIIQRSNTGHWRR
ncbi:hypothetical protein V6N00_12600 [Tersicoccus sp. MR15.9]|uniref:hypothetical protein n=1 Tax=Tersicoccus mangrovi TaxID=3121635 RepID=UPI002FE59ED6